MTKIIFYCCIISLGLTTLTFGLLLEFAPQFVLSVASTAVHHDKRVQCYCEVE